MKVHLAPDLYHEVLSKTFPDEGLIETVYGADLLELANDISNDSDAFKLFANWSCLALTVAGKHETYRHPSQCMLAKPRRDAARHGMALRSDFGGCMSRSRRKVPIVGIAGNVSEAHDKRLWHKRWRSKEAISLKTLTKTTDGLWSHMTKVEAQVSDTWTMAKDGKSYWSIYRQNALAERLATNRASLPTERQSLKKRLLKKWMAK